MRAAKRLLSKSAVPLPVLAADRIPESVAEQLKDFARRYAPDVAVGIIDSEGLRTPNEAPTRRYGSPKMGNLFSAQWSGTPVSQSRTSSKYGSMSQTTRHQGKSRRSKFGKRCWVLLYKARAMNGQADNEAFARLILAIEPSLAEIVINWRLGPPTLSSASERARALHLFPTDRLVWKWQRTKPLTD